MMTLIGFCPFCRLCPARRCIQCSVQLVPVCRGAVIAHQSVALGQGRAVWCLAHTVCESECIHRVGLILGVVF